MSDQKKSPNQAARKQAGAPVEGQADGQTTGRTAEQTTEQAASQINDQMKVRLEKMKAHWESGDIPYKNGFSPDDRSFDLHQSYDSLGKEEMAGLEPIRAKVAGRVMAIRHFGKAGFVRIQDESGLMQLFMQKNALGEDPFARYKKLDVGDFIIAEGTLFKTKTNELSVQVESFDLLTKSLRPLPEKYHGITDVEARYRQRYLDLMMSEETRERFKKRSQIVSLIRHFFEAEGFMEVETPMMHSLVSGAEARPFKTHHNTLDMELFLRIAPELHLKRLLVGGFEKVFEINRNFRNEGISTRHNPEFTMIEFYWAYATYENLMDLTEKLFKQIAVEVTGSHEVKYQDAILDFGKPFERISAEEAVLKYTEFKDPAKIRDRDSMLAYIESKGWKVDKDAATGKLLMLIFEEEVETKLIQPTFLTQFPLDVSPLARKNEKDPYLTDRFELMIYGREIGNAFSELNDPVDQKERFRKQADAKAAGDAEATDMDEDYIHALEYGMPPAAGEGLGIDRMVMLFTDAASIRDVILFPQLRKSSR